MRLSRDDDKVTLRCANEYEREELYETCSLMFTECHLMSQKCGEPLGPEVVALAEILEQLAGKTQLTSGVYDVEITLDDAAELAKIMSLAGELMFNSPEGLALRCNILGSRLDNALGTMGFHGSDTISTIV